MTVLFDGPIDAVDGTILATSGEESGEVMGDLDASFAGQTQAVIGAGFAGALVLQVGLQAGDVGLRVELNDSEPPVDPSWDDIVEASFTPLSSTVSFENFDAVDGLPVIQLPVQSYRVRYCGRDVDAGNDALMLDPGEAPVDSYALYFWPAEPSQDAVVKLTSESAQAVSAEWLERVGESG